MFKRLFKRKRLAKFAIRQNEAIPVSIVADAAVASQGVREGKFIPLLIIDCSKRLDISELVRVHQHLPPGDVECQWGQRHGTRGKIDLFLKFIRPSKIFVLLEFDIERQGGLVDQVLRAGALYIQAGQIGDRLITTPDNPKILIHIPDTGFRSEWEMIFMKHLTDGFKRRGLKKSKAQEAALMFLEEWRKFGKFQMR